MTKSGTMLGLVPTLNVQCNNHESQASPYANTVEKHLGLKVFIRRTRLEVSHRLLFARETGTQVHISTLCRAQGCWITRNLG